MNEQDKHRLALISDRIVKHQKSYNYEFVETADWSDVEFLFDLLKRETVGDEESRRLAQTTESYIGALADETAFEVIEGTPTTVHTERILTMIGDYLKDDSYVPVSTIIHRELLAATLVARLQRLR